MRSSRFRLSLVAMMLALLGYLIIHQAAEDPAKAAKVPDEFAHHLFRPVPDGAVVSLELDKEEYLLGENVLVHYVVENTSQKPFNIDIGGDYRAASRPLRYRVTATDEDGERVADPDPTRFFLGGISSRPEIKPGDRWVNSLALLRYCKFAKPGRYKIRVEHDLGWKEEEGRKRPLGETTITLKMPTEQQAEQLVAQYEKMKVDDGFTWGEKRSPYPDFATLRLPIYLKPLTARAGRGFQPAVTGIGFVETPNATAALIDLLGHEDREIVLLAARTLNTRLPDPQFGGQLPPRAFDASTERRKQLVKVAWRERFAGAVRTHAIGFLNSDDTELASVGGFMLQCLGGPDDVPVLIAAMDRSLEGLKPRRTKDANILDPPGAGRELLRAIGMLLTRGAAVPEDPSTPGEIILYLDNLTRQQQVRPRGWEKQCAKWLSHDNPYVRESVLRSTPLPLSDEFRAKLPRMFKDPDLGVQRAACELAQKIREPMLRESVLAVFAETRHQWVINAARNAAVALGGKTEVVRISAERMHEPDMLSEAMTSFAMIVKHSGGRGGSTNVSRDEVLEMQRLWLAFVEEQRDEIQEGSLFRIGDPRLKPELFGKACTFHLQGGGTWPPRQQ